MRLATTRMDSKGRISIPMALRHHMKLNQGDELMLTASSKEFRLAPAEGNTELSIKFKKDVSVSVALSSVMGVLARHKADIISSEVQTRGDCALWHAAIDTSDYKKLRNSIASIETVQELSLRKN